MHLAVCWADQQTDLLLINAHSPMEPKLQIRTVGLGAANEDENIEV